MEDIIFQHIAKVQGVCGGKACIKGHRIRVMDIVAWHEMRGFSADEIVAMFPGITLSDVHAALAYYFDHRPEIDDDFQHDKQSTKELLSRHPSKLKDELSA